jgi:predicted ribosome quality control (RQC) complex YloA/Tae2 family protein
MSFDALTLSAVRDELEPLLTGARLQKVVLPDELSLAIEAFAPGAGRTNVLLTAHPEESRVQRIPGLPARGIERDTPFSLVVRKHLRDARIRSVGQPRLERVFDLDCEQRDASGQHYRVVLIVEAMGRRSNLVLVDEHGVIIDAARRSPPSRNSRRPVLPHLPYVPPPPQDRLFHEEVSGDRLAEEAAGRTGLLARFLSDRLAGLSPLSGRELAFRVTGAIDTPLAEADWPQVAAAARDFLGYVDAHDWQPSVAFDGARPLEYAPYVLTHLEANGMRVVPYDGISAAIDAYYAGLAEAGPARRGDPLTAERRALLAPIERALETTERRNAALLHQLDNGHLLRDPLRRAGELILTHQAALTPGATELAVAGERIELDATLSAVDNAQAYFARYRKAREAEARVPALLEEGRQRATHLADLRTLVELADSMDSVRALRREVGAASGSKVLAERKPPKRGSRRQKTAAKASGSHRRIELGDGWEVLVGTSAAGNAAVTFELARPDDLWLHARGVPGSHVILRGPDATPPDHAIERAAQLAAYHSSARTAAAVEVDITPKRYVKKIPNGPPGLVRYENERTVRVTPQPPKPVALSLPT